MKRKMFTVLSGIAVLLAAMLVVLTTGKVNTAKADGDHTHCICGGNCDVLTDSTKDGHAAAVAVHTCNTTQVWAAVGTLAELKSAVTASKTEETYVYLTANITLDGTINLTGNNLFHLCLNGFTLTGKNNTRMFNTYIDNGTATMFTICDCSAEKTGKVTCQGTQDKNRGHFLLLYFSNSTFECYGGTFTGAKNTYESGENGRGGLIASYSGNVYIFGGTFQGNEAGRSGGLLNASSTSTKTQFYIYDGLFKENHSMTAAGGCIAIPSGNGNIYGGTFDGNYASGYAGAIYVGGSSTLTISGGTFQNNTCTKDGGVMDVESSGATVVSGGTFLNNSAPTGSGGTFSVYASTLTISGGTISGGVAKTYGGNICIGATSFLNLSGGTVTGGKVGIYAADNGGSKVEGKGGNIYIDSSTSNKTNGKLTMTGGTVTKGHAKTGTGGNIWVNGLCEISGGEVSEGTGTSGGNIFINIGNDAYTKGVCNISGGTVRDGQTLDNTGANPNTGSGMNININGGSTYTPGTLNVSGTAKITFTDDSLESTGSGANICCSGIMTLADSAEISNGKTQKHGGNIYISTANADVTNKATLTMSGGTIKGGCNLSSDYNGGNVCISAYSTMNMSGGVITEGYGKGNGWNVAVIGNFNGSGTATIKNVKGSYKGTATGNNSFSAQKSTARVLLSGGTYEHFQAVATNAEATITGGTFTGSVSAYNAKVTISGGVFKSSVGTTYNSGKLIITGGYFTQAPYLSSGKTGTVSVEGGYYVVNPGTTFLKAGCVAASCNVEANGTTYNYQVGEGFVITTTSRAYSGGGLPYAVNVSGGGTYLKNATATLSAPDIANFEFKHWVCGDQVVSSDRTAEITVTKEADYEALYEFATPNINFTVQAVTTDESATITYKNGEEDWTTVPTAFLFQNVPGTTDFIVKVAECDKFIGWFNGTKKLVSTDFEYSFTVLDNVFLQAAYDVLPSEEAMVIYMSDYDQIISVQAADADAPAAPTRIGQVFLEWKTEKEATEGGFIIKRPVYEAATNTATVIVKNFVTQLNGTVAQVVEDADLTFTAKIGETITVTAPETLEYENETYYLAGFTTFGEQQFILGMGTTLKLKNADTETRTIMAVYADEQIPAEPTVAITLANLDDQKAFIVASRTFPADYTIVEQGFVVVKPGTDFADTVDAATEQLILGGQYAKSLVSKSLEGTETTALSFGNLGTDNLYMRAFVAYKDPTGVQGIIYSNVVYGNNSGLTVVNSFELE